MPHADYDVVVLGGGIAGLLLASELARNHRLLLIEKSPTIVSHKYWLTDRASADANPLLAPAVDLTYSSLDFVAYDDRRYRCVGDYVLWDTPQLIDLLLSKVAAHGGKVLTGHTVYSYSTDKHRIHIMANSSTISAELAVDCMGFGSPIIYAKGVVDILGYYMLYGGSFRAKELPDPVGLHNMTLSKTPSYVEAFPTSDGRLHLILILPGTQSAKPNTLREEFDFVVNRSPYSRFIEGSLEKNSFLGGIIPVGHLRRRALDRLFFFGESGQANPAATATALTRMLHTYRETASALSQRIADSRLSAADLSSAGQLTVDHFNRRLHVGLFKDILRWDSDRFARIVGEMQAVGDHDLVNRIMFGNLDMGHRLVLTTLPVLARRRAINIMRSVARGFLGF